MTRNPPRSAKSNAGDRKGVSENASRDALSGRIGLFGRAIRPARSTTRGSEAEIAWKVAFGCFSLTGGKPNGECRLNDAAMSNEQKPMSDFERMRVMDPKAVRDYLGDGVFGGVYQKPNAVMLELWQVAVAETQDLLEGPWS